MSSFAKPRVKAPAPELIQKTNSVFEKFGIRTICTASACPNITECYARGTGTFLILGPICTRRCSFCNVPHGRAHAPDPSEPRRVAEAVQALGLRYVVITSVDRDDLRDFGVGAFCEVLAHIRARSDTKVEMLTPDFQGKRWALTRIVQARPDKLAHNIETVERLYKKIKSAGSYARSLEVLAHYAKSGITTKSSIIVGMGESIEEVKQAIVHLHEVGVRQLTIGQYLAPSPRNLAVQRYYSDKEFEELAAFAKETGFVSVASGTLVRSSYYAERM